MRIYSKSASRSSPTLATGTSVTPAGTSAAATLSGGRMTWVKPSRAASRTRSAGVRRPAHLAGQADLAEQRRRPRAPAGCAGSTPAPRRPRDRPPARRPTRPPATLAKTSSPDMISPARFSSTASSSDDAVGVEAVGGALGVAVGAGADERLHLDEQRPRAFDGAQHRRPGDAIRPLGEEQRRRVRHRLQAGAGHLEHADLGGRAEAVLHRAHDAVGVMPLALEVEHRVDDVLEHLGPGQRAVLGDVADDERRHVLALGREQQLRRRLAHLGDAARRRLQLGREHGLDRVEHEQRRLQPHAPRRGRARGRSRRTGTADRRRRRAARRAP